MEVVTRIASTPQEVSIVLVRMILIWDWRVTDVSGKPQLRPLHLHLLQLFLLLLLLLLLLLNQQQQQRDLSSQ
jgi:hypothetical protein